MAEPRISTYHTQTAHTGCIPTIGSCETSLPVFGNKRNNATAAEVPVPMPQGSFGRLPKTHGFSLSRSTDFYQIPIPQGIYDSDMIPGFALKNLFKNSAFYFCQLPSALQHVTGTHLIFCSPHQSKDNFSVMHRLLAVIIWRI